MTWSSLLVRVHRGDPRRKSRLHDYEGNRVDWAGMRFLGPAAASALLCKLGRRSSLPWISYRATKRLAALIASDWRVLEFGSGQSTVWLGRRCAYLVSIENDPVWYDRVGAQIAAAGLKNVDHRLRTTESEYLEVAGAEDQSYDLALVDGMCRDKAVSRALTLVRPGGYIYLDNSDAPTPEHKAARKLLLSAATSESALERFVDFAPMQVAVNQGLLLRVGNPQ